MCYKVISREEKNSSKAWIIQSWGNLNYWLYYMASTSFMSRQQEMNLGLWLAWGQDGAFLHVRGYPLCPGSYRGYPHNKFFIDQACSVKMTAWYWPRSFFCVCVYGPQLRLGPWTPSQKENLANIQLLWPHARSITHNIHTEEDKYFVSETNKSLVFAKEAHVREPNCLHGCKIQNLS